MEGGNDKYTITPGHGALTPDRGHWPVLTGDTAQPGTEVAQGHWLTAAAPGVTDREREWGQALVAHWAVETEMEVI